MVIPYPTMLRDVTAFLNTKTLTVEVNTFFRLPSTCMDSAPTFSVTWNWNRFTMNAPVQLATSAAAMVPSLLTYDSLSMMIAGPSMTNENGRRVRQENAAMYRSRLMESSASFPSSSSCMHDLVPLAMLDKITSVTPNQDTSGTPPALIIAPPTTGRSVSHTLPRSRFFRITTPMAAVNAGDDAASACSRLTSTYLKDATARRTLSAMTCDRKNTFHPSALDLIAPRAVHPIVIENSHHRNETIMCRKVRNTGSAKCSPIKTLFMVISTTVLTNHPATDRNARTFALFATTGASSAAPFIVPVFFEATGAPV